MLNLENLGSEFQSEKKTVGFGGAFPKVPILRNPDMIWQ